MAEEQNVPVIDKIETDVETNTEAETTKEAPRTEVKKPNNIIHFHEIKDSETRSVGDWAGFMQDIVGNHLETLRQVDVISQEQAQDYKQLLDEYFRFITNSKSNIDMEEIYPHIVPGKRGIQSGSLRPKLTIAKTKKGIKYPTNKIQQVPYKQELITTYCQSTRAELKLTPDKYHNRINITQTDHEGRTYPHTQAEIEQFEQFKTDVRLAKTDGSQGAFDLMDPKYLDAIEKILATYQDMWNQIPVTELTLRLKSHKAYVENPHNDEETPQVIDITLLPNNTLTITQRKLIDGTPNEIHFIQINSTQAMESLEKLFDHTHKKMNAINQDNLKETNVIPQRCASIRAIGQATKDPNTLYLKP